jgi:hypothetical protein
MIDPMFVAVMFAMWRAAADFFFSGLAVPPQIPKRIF